MSTTATSRKLPAVLKKRIDALAAERDMQRSGQGYPLDSARKYLEAKVNRKAAVRPGQRSWRN